MLPRFKYAPLTAYLAALPAETTTVTLSFAAIEALIRAPLPTSAYTTGWHWWSNVPRVSRGRTWRSVGWVVAAVRRGPGAPPAWTVTFARVPSETSA